jgi:hypothetical protein
MRKPMSPFDEDAINPEAVAEVIESVLLYLLPPDKRAVALAIAVKAEDAERAEREAAGGFPLIKVFDPDEMQNSPGICHWNSIMQLKARLVYVFVRNITNNHSKADAARLLFQWHHNAPGSGHLEEYIDDLPRDVKENAA